MTTTTLTRPAAATRPATAVLPAVRDRRPSTARLTVLEIRKSLSTRSGLGMAIAASVLPAAAVGSIFALGQKIPSAAEMLAIFGTLVAMLTLAVGVLTTAGEWTHQTVQTTFLTVPRRHRVLTAKYAGMALLGAAISAVVAGSTLAVAAVAAGPAFSWAGTGLAVLATIGTGAAMTALGAGIGAAVANAPAALTGTYVLLLVAMNLLRAVKPAWANHADPLQNMADLISRQGTAITHIAVLAGWVLTATVAGTAVTRTRALA
jgi:ABC-2 type transport system permease protein